MPRPLLASRLFWALALVAVVAAAALLVFGAGRTTARVARVADYAESRLAVVKHQMAAAGPGHVLLAGDSNIELFGAPREGCGRELVNAGVSGATVKNYEPIARRLVPWARAHATVLTIGTNDLLRKSEPLSAHNIDRFAGAAATIIATLGERSDSLIVTAIPPVGDHQLSAVDADAVERYSTILQEACRKPHCVFVDPFQAERTTMFGVAREGATEGLHLLRYQAAYADLLRGACHTPD